MRHHYHQNYHHDFHDLVLLIVIAMMVLLSEKVQEALIGLSLDHQYPILLLLLYLLQCHHNDEDQIYCSLIVNISATIWLHQLPKSCCCTG